MSHIRPTRSLRAARVAVAVALVLAASARGDTLREQLGALAEQHGFRVTGLARIGDEPALPVAGTVRDRLEALLEGYDHVVDAPDGQVRRVIVLGAGRARPDALVIRTERVRGHHAVRARLEGAGGATVEVDLIVDSGASSVVLPESMIEKLGFDAAMLMTRRGQTVNGPVQGRWTQLASLEVGGAVRRDVDVLFVPDDGLGGVALLGMSFLAGYAFTLDDAGGRLVLRRR